MTGTERGLDGGRPLDTMTFEEIVDELERTARAMEASDLGIERAAELYERAGLLHRTATERLAKVRVRLDELRGAP